MKEQVAEIVSAYLRRNTVATDQVPVVIRSVYEALSGVGNPAPEPTTLTPAVSIRRSVEADAIICLECGARAKIIKRHLRTAHELTPEDYRAKWGLSRDYPLVAKNYAAQRSAMAKSIGLGRKGRPSGGRRKSQSPMR